MLTSGDRVGPYEIRGFLGQGGMGAVYRAFDPRLERTVALKVIAPPSPSSAPSASSGEPGSGPAAAGDAGSGGHASADGAARLLREARAVASLSHPNVVAVFDVGEANGRLYLAMEYVVGSTLRALIGDRQIPLPRRIRWLVDIARALDAAHRVGLVHRDVKPENVMIREDGGVKVLDFGIARRTRLDDGRDAHHVDTVTGAGAIAGTPVYMAPEQIKGADVDARCDQFAWGVTAYELLAGTRPWPDGGDVLSTIAKVLTDPPRPLRQRVELPMAVEEVVSRALAKDPATRFESMRAVADALEPFATNTLDGARVRITPQTKDEAAAFAPTTRVPTTMPAVPTGESNGERAPATRRLTQLVVPLLLIAGLGGAAWWAQRKAALAVQTPGKPAASVAGSASAFVKATDHDRPLSTVAEAEKAYREAMSLWHDGAAARARTALKRAVELDPTFAAAHLELAIQTSSSDPTAAQASFQSAFEHRHMLLARDAALLEASVPYVRPKPDLEEWETRMTAMVFQYPRDPELQFYLGRANEERGDDEMAKAAYAASVRLDEAFVPGLAALANVDKNLGRVKSALSATERCLARSPIASICIETRYDVFTATHDCHRAREEATQWSALEPQSPRPADALARALYADGAPRPSVEEALARKWSLLSPDLRKRQELVDRVQLAVTDGDLARAEDLAREFDSALPIGADRADHAVPARLRVAFLAEMDRTSDAAKVARNYLDRMAAWQAYPFAPDPSIDFYEPLFRAGEITAAELRARREDWITQERKRTGDRNARATWATWTAVWGGFAETREEALDALERRPREPLPPEPQRALVLDFALGKTLALAGNATEASAHLERVLGTCASLDASLLVLRARSYLGLVHETKGDLAAARTNYEKVVQSWPKGSPSRTVKRAEERLAILTRK